MRNIQDHITVFEGHDYTERMNRGLDRNRIFRNKIIRTLIVGVGVGYIFGHNLPKWVVRHIEAADNNKVYTDFYSPNIPRGLATYLTGRERIKRLDGILKSEAKLILDACEIRRCGQLIVKQSTGGTTSQMDLNINGYDFSISGNKSGNSHTNVSSLTVYSPVYSMSQPTFGQAAEAIISVRSEASGKVVSVDSSELTGYFNSDLIYASTDSSTSSISTVLYRGSAPSIYLGQNSENAKLIDSNTSEYIDEFNKQAGL